MVSANKENISANILANHMSTEFNKNDNMHVNENKQLATLLFSYIDQLACSNLNWMLNNQSEFDKVVVKEFGVVYASSGISNI